MHILDTLFSALAIYYKRRRYAISEIQNLKMYMKIQSAECKNRDPGYGFIVLRKKLKM